MWGGHGVDSWDGGEAGTDHRPAHASLWLKDPVAIQVLVIPVCWIGPGTHQKAL